MNENNKDKSPTNIKLTAVIKKEIGDEFLNDNINDEDSEEIQSKPSPIQFSVKVMVEKWDDSSGTHLEKDIVENKEINSEDADDIGLNKTYILRKILPHTKKNTLVPVKEYTINKKTILKAAELQSKENTTQPDKYIDMEIRNFHGVFKQSEKSFHDELIYKALEKWKNWYEVCPSFRNSPLLYICFICKKGWWRLHTFREHIKMKHREQNFKLTTKQLVHEFYVAACTKNSSLSIKNVKINSKCWKCGKSAEFHPLTMDTSKYQCEGCRAGFMTCTKLTQHEGMCMEYMEIKCEKLKLKTFECVTCSLCFQNFINQTEFDVHMTECHSVRSDEPVFMQPKRCSYCHGNFYNFQYHDCPKRIKIIKCKNCCRKFNTKGFKLLHMQFNGGLFNCFLCGKSMKECRAMEHMVEHSKNYMLLYQCASCRDNVLFTTETNFKNHIKLHERFVDRRRWSTRVLIPTKCLNGEIVKSETILNIPVTDHQFMYTLHRPKITDKPTIIDNTKQSTTNNDDRGNNIRNDSAPLTGSVTQVKCDDYRQQARLDAEIQKYVETEIALSKLFKVSNAYQKLLEKETEETKTNILTMNTDTKEKSDWNDVNSKVRDTTQTNNEEILNLNSEIIIKEESDWNDMTEVNEDFDLNDVTLKLANTTESKEEEFNLNTKTVIKQDIDKESLEMDITSVDNMEQELNNMGNEEWKSKTKVKPDWNDATENVGNPTESNKEEVLNLNSEIIIKEESDWNDMTEVNEDNDLNHVTLKLANTTGSKDDELNSNNETAIKEDTDKESPEMDITSVDNMEQEYNNMGNEEWKNKAKEKAEWIDVTAKVGDPTKSNKEETLNLNSEIIIKEESDWNDMTEVHEDCDLNDITLKFASTTKFKEELNLNNKTVIKEDIDKESPEMDISSVDNMGNEEWKNKAKKKPDWNGVTAEVGDPTVSNKEDLLNLNSEIIIKEESDWNDMTEVNEDNDLNDVTIKFANTTNSKEEELNLNNKTVIIEDIDKQSPEEDIIFVHNMGHEEWKKTMDPKMKEAAVDALLAKEKPRITQCVVCKKQFDRRNTCKRHLIEHLLSEALKVIAETNNQLRCQICNLDISKIDLYKQHMREHASLPLYRCDLCSKCFGDSSNYSKHRKKHNLFSFVCDACGGKFRAKASLITHLKVHENNATKCEECHKTFNTILQLKRHKNSKHMAQLGTYPCRLCKERFCSLKEKRDHLWLIHKQKSVKADCPICNKTYRRMRDVKHHMKSVHFVDLFKYKLPPPTSPAWKIFPRLSCDEK